MLRRTVLSTRVLRVGVRISIVQEIQQDPRCIPLTSDINALEDVSIHRDFLIFEMLSIC